MNILDEGLILRMIDYHLSQAIHFVEINKSALADYHEAKAEEWEEKLDY